MSQGQNEWNKGLMSCFDDIGLCCITIFVPCVPFGQTMEAMGKTSCIVGALIFLVPLLDIVCWFIVRGEIREKYNLKGSILDDCFAICCCPLCALIQENQQVQVNPEPAAVVMRS